MMCKVSTEGIIEKKKAKDNQFAVSSKITTKIVPKGRKSVNQKGERQDKNSKRKKSQL